MAAGEEDPEVETYNPWSIVHVVFTHLSDQGLHPILGESGDPGPPAAALLRALGIEPAAEGNREVVRSVATNNGARLSDFAILQIIKRSESDSILIEEMGRRKDIPRHLFQQLIAKAAENTRKRLGSERPDATGQIDSLVTELAGSLHSKFGPASKTYFSAKRSVAREFQLGSLNQHKIFEYAQTRRFEEATVGLSLLCSLPVDVVERALTSNNREMALILAKALGFSWDTAMALLFLGAPEHRIHAQELEDTKREFEELNVETSRSVLRTYQSRKQSVVADSEGRRLPQLHSI